VGETAVVAGVLKLVVTASVHGMMAQASSDTSQTSTTTTTYEHWLLLLLLPSQSMEWWHRHHLTQAKHQQQRPIILCPIAIAQHRTDNRITCVCLSVCQSVVTPTTAISIRFSWNFEQCFGAWKVWSSLFGVKIRSPLPLFYPNSPVMHFQWERSNTTVGGGPMTYSDG